MKRSSMKGNNLAANLLVVLWFGTLWGACEALLGGVLHSYLPPTYPGKFMIAVAMGLMAFAIRRTGRPWIPLGMALVASPLKLFSAVIFSLPVCAPAVLNPAFSILAQGVAFALFAVALGRVLPERPFRFGLAGAAAGALQSLLYVALVRGPGLWLYPPLETLQALGTKFPHWVASLPQIANFLSVSIPYSVLAAGVAALAIGCAPLRTRVQMRPAVLTVGVVLCLVTFFLSSWLV